MHSLRKVKALYAVVFTIFVGTGTMSPSVSAAAVLPQGQNLEAGAGSNSTGQNTIIQPGKFTARDEYYLFIVEVGLDAERKTFSDLQIEYKNWTRMRDDETAQMLNIVISSNNELEASEREAREAVSAWKKSTTIEQRHRSGVPDNVRLLSNQRYAVVDRTMATLESALGKDTFAKLNSFVLRALDDKSQTSGHTPPPGFVDPATLLPGPDATRVKR